MEIKNMKIRIILIVLIVFSVWVKAQQNEETKPNFIIILADDLGYGDLGFTGSTQIKTPHIDALANSGVIFTEAYVSAPVCAPSRAGLITGRNQVNFGYDNNLTDALPQFNPEYSGLPVSEKTIADSCKIKQNIVQQDEKEKNLRKILNLGHTFAHAYEATLSYSKKINHGEAVIIGIATAAKFSFVNNILIKKDYEQIINHINNLKIPINLNYYFKKKDIN